MIRSFLLLITALGMGQICFAEQTPKVHVRNDTKWKILVAHNPALPSSLLTEKIVEPGASAELEIDPRRIDFLQIAYSNKTYRVSHPMNRAQDLKTWMQSRPGSDVWIVVYNVKPLPEFEHKVAPGAMTKNAPQVLPFDVKYVFEVKGEGLRRGLPSIPKDLQAPPPPKK